MAANTPQTSGEKKEPREKETVAKEVAAAPKEKKKKALIFSIFTEIRSKIHEDSICISS